MKPDLIFDIGMHRGCDSLYYLRKGFRVVAVEANPALAESASARLVDWIKDKRLTILNLGIGADTKELDFYINQKQDDWSSFVPEFGMRGGAFEMTKVQCRPLQEIFEEFGTPYYLKVDIEGHDDHAIRALELTEHRPRYVSVEATVDRFAERMHAIGYLGFKWINQNWHQCLPPRQPPLEGEFCDMTITGHMSGPFGEETYGRWMSLDEFAAERSLLRAKQIEESAQHRACGVPLQLLMLPPWYDWHARFGF